MNIDHSEVFLRRLVFESTTGYAVKDFEYMNFRVSFKKA